MTGLRGSRLTLQQLLTCSRAFSETQQHSRAFTSLTLGSWRSATTSPAAASAAALGWQRVAALVPSLADAQWLAAPKHKVSPHRKGKRSANKFIRFVPVVAQCSKCQRVFQQHSMPSKCEEEDCPAFTLRARPET